MILDRVNKVVNLYEDNPGLELFTCNNENLNPGIQFQFILFHEITTAIYLVLLFLAGAGTEFCPVISRTMASASKRTMVPDSAPIPQLLGQAVIVYVGDQVQDCKPGIFET
jgi:hypothetical protein